MIKNNKTWKKFEREIYKKKNSIKENFEVVEALYEEARFLKIFPLKNPLEDIEKDIEYARVINGV